MIKKKRTVNKYPKAFRKMAMERLKSCESVTALSEELGIHRTLLYDLDHLRTNIEEFIERYYNPRRLHSALGYRPPDEFEQAAITETTSLGATMSFFRHEKIYRSDVNGKPTEADFPDHRLDESSVGYSLAGWSPPEPAAASPTEDHSEKEEPV